MEPEGTTDPWPAGMLEDPEPPPGDSEHCVTCGDERHGRCGTQWTAGGRHGEHRCHLAAGYGGGCECCCGARHARPASDG